MLLALLSASCGQGKIAGGEADGPRIFADVCARCHGDTGAPPPSLVMQYGVADLTREEMRAMSLSAVRQRISEGVVRKGMPAFGTALTKEQLDAVAEHVKSLAQ